MAVTEINITASGGGNIPCMAAFPSGGPATAVVAVPSIFGVNDDMAMVAERLAGEGYIAIIPDPFWRDEDPGIIGHDEEGRARAFARMGRTPFEQAFGDVMISARGTTAMAKLLSWVSATVDRSPLSPPPNAVSRRASPITAPSWTSTSTPCRI
jgi:dienelactone hydrolase